MHTTDALLGRFHSSFPGATDAALGQGSLDGGSQTSYDLLAGFIATQTDGEVAMDLACGDGALTARILQAAPPPAVVIGVDSSAAALKRARRRVRHRGVFHSCRAQALPTPAGQVAAVGCHMALMLFEPVAPVLEQVARVLVPGGAFGAILPGEDVSCPVMSTLEGLLAAQAPPLPALGDPRTRTVDGLTALLHPHFERIEVSEHVLSISGTLPALWSQTLALSERVASLEEGVQAKLRADLLSALGEGPATLRMGLRFVRGWTPVGG